MVFSFGKSDIKSPGSLLINKALRRPSLLNPSKITCLVCLSGQICRTVS